MNSLPLLVRETVRVAPNTVNQQVNSSHFHLPVLALGLTIAY